MVAPGGGEGGGFIVRIYPSRKCSYNSKVVYTDQWFLTRGDFDIPHPLHGTCGNIWEHSGLLQQKYLVNRSQGCYETFKMHRTAQNVKSAEAERPWQTDYWIGSVYTLSQDSNGEANPEINNTPYKIPSGFGKHDAYTDTYASTTSTH